VTDSQQQSLWAKRLAARRNDFDVTNTVRVSSPSAVCAAVHDVFAKLYPGESFKPVSRAFLDFQRLFNGEYPGYLGCDTVYHDIQHTLDMTLANARLIAGFENSHDPRDQLGPRRAVVGLVTSLFHDAGYIRRRDDGEFANGAEFTSFHVSRSADFLEAYMPQIGFADFAATAARIVHFSGYELQPEQIHVDEPKDRRLGHLLGTADLLAQMADRCYLEKCRDRLYKEFVIGGVAVENSKPGEYMVRYKSGQDLLQKTPVFYQQIMRDRLNLKFNRAYRYIEVLFDGHNPYIEAIRNNITHLIRIISTDNWALLRREPAYFLGVTNAVHDVESYVSAQLAALSGRAIEKDELLMPV